MRLARSSRRSGRRGSGYLVVLGATLIVATMGLGAMLAVRAQMRAANLLSDATEARQYALSAIELGRLWISQDPEWRKNRTCGVWASNQPIGEGTLTLEASDPIDGNLGNRPHDPVVLKATGVKRQTRHIVQVTLSASPEPLPALKCAAHVDGELHVTGDHRLTAAAATVSTNKKLYNEATIAASVEASGAKQVGTVTGTLNLSASAKSFPDSGVPEMYAQFGTLINPGNTIEKQVLAPGYNPWGDTNPDGVYVIRISSDLVIKNSRIQGTLVVICSGCKVTFENNVLIHPYRADYPSLIINGNAEFNYASNTTLSESGSATNFNPPGAPYNGVQDTDTTDEFVSEVRGLVHVTGTVRLSGTAMIRGLLLCESGAGTDALKCDGTNEIVYDKHLYLNPPQGYTASVKMLIQPGTWRQCVD